MSENNGHQPPDKQDGNRDERGRFRRGHSGNPRGRPRGRTIRETLRQLLETKTESGQAYRDLLSKKLLQMALEGDIRALSHLVHHVDGRTKDSAEDDSVTLQLPPLTDAESCHQAAGQIMEAMGDGSISVDTATKLIGVVDKARAAVETLDLSRRLTDLERGRSSTDRDEAYL